MIQANKHMLAGVAALLFLNGPFNGFACGPDFPNWLLTDGDNAVLRTPEAYFHKELERMRLVTTPHVARVTGDPRQSTVDRDLEDLAEALAKAGVPAKEAESRIANHQAERSKAQAYAEAVATAANGTPVSAPLPRVTPGLPPEFADYFRGAIAWHQADFLAARAEWLRLLERPSVERRYRSTWAAYMLGKSWEAEDPRQAIAWYRRVRELAEAGLVDSLGLAVESLGWEARLEWNRENYPAAVELYLAQAAAGDPTAESSLKVVAADALRRGRRTLKPLAKSPRTQRLITAYVISGGYREQDIDVDGPVKETGILLWTRAAAKVSVIPAPNAGLHDFRPPAAIWLDAVESANVRDVESAEQLALAAYQAGEMDAARRWLDLARPTTMAEWLRAKLLLRDGKVDQARELLAKLSRALPVTDGTAAPPGRELAESVYLRTSESGSHGPATVKEAVRGELAVVDLARRRYLEALDSLMHSTPSYWMDAAYVAERVLDLEELRSYVDRNFPSPPATTAPGEPAAGGMTTGQQLRYLLARRLARAYRFAEARQYYPTNWLPAFDELAAAWREAENTAHPDLKRGQALLRAAVLTRDLGLELIGTEVEPDWRIHAGNFAYGVSIGDRVPAGGVQSRVAASREELSKAASHGVLPEDRWHYRVVAAVIGWEAAKLLRGAAAPGDPTERARMLFSAAVTLMEHGISCVQFNPDPPPGPRPATNLSGRVTQALAGVPPGHDFISVRPASSADITPEGLWQGGFSSAALAWEAARLLPNNSDETAQILCRGGSWIAHDPPAADILYKTLVRRCRKTAIGAEADRIRWFPRLDAQGHVVPRKLAAPVSAAAVVGAAPSR